jgi:hypothetical protein
MTKKRIKTVWELRDYDVWGNKEDGYEVNDATVVDRDYLITLTVTTYNKGTTDLEFDAAYPTDRQIRQALGIKPRVKIDTEGDDTTIYVNAAKNGYPLGEMRCVSHKSLSPIRK